MYNCRSRSVPEIHSPVAGMLSNQPKNISQGRICTDNFTCCHTEIEVADQTFHLTQSQYTDTGPTSPSSDPITPRAWQGSHWSANFEVTGMTRPRKKSRRKRDLNPGSSALEADALPLGQRGGPVWRRDVFTCFTFFRPLVPVGVAGGGGGDAAVCQQQGGWPGEGTSLEF